MGRIISLIISSFVLLVVSCNQNKTKENVKNEFYTNGHLKYTVPLKNGKEEGAEISYYDDGIIQSITYFKDGKKEGSGCDFYPDGRVSEVVNYKSDLFENYAVNFDDSGQVVDVINAEHDLKASYLCFDYGNFSKSPEQPYTTVITHSMPFFTFNPDADTITLGETYSAKIILNFPKKGYRTDLFVLDKNGKDYYLIKGETGTEAIYTEKPEIVGWHNFEISANMYKIQKENRDGGYMKIKDYYSFIGKYFVRDGVQK